MNDESIFNAALRKSDPAERAAFLNQACANDAEMRSRVEALLGAHAAAGSFLAPPLAENIDTITLAPRSEATSPPPVVECPGTRIGPYKLLQQIGEGGMGTVWMAEQMEPVRRNVALKIVKAGLDSSQVIARFEAERQALALMDHPNIARVLDAGSTASGRPFFVMELVKGAPITKYCDDHKLSVRQRLELFIPVCLALQHAHQKGIIHRDIKPSNVLVAPYDGKPVVKVIDFGVAKATGQRLTEKTMFTQFGAVIGTLEYMSPEQAELNNQDIDTRSDIYALGVLLYELLTGTTPLDMQRLRGAAFAAILMQIQENEPPRPSTRLSESRATLAMISTQRQTEPARLAKLMRGELDWIVMKALDKDRSRRYDTAGNLARDIEHHLREEPVEAGPPSATYRLRKLLRRNRGAVAAAVIVFFALVGGTIGTALGLVRANQALDSEAEQRRQAELARSEEARARNAADADRIVATHARDDAERNLYFNRISLAYQYWLGDHLDQSSRILDLCPPAQRGWEWRYLDHLHHADFLTLPGNGQFTTNIQFSKDGKRLAAFTLFGDAGMRIWDLTSRRPLAEITSSKNRRQFSCDAFAADGNMVALGDETGAITFWQADTGKLVREFAKLKNSVGSLSFSPDGRWLAAARADGRKGEMLNPRNELPRNEDLVVWDVASGKELFHPKDYGFIAKFSPDGSRLLTYRKNTAARSAPWIPEFFFALFETTTWTEVTHGQLQPRSYSFSGDGKRLVLGGADRQNSKNFLQIVDPATGKELHTYSPSAIGDIALNNDGSIACLSEGFPSAQIQIWDMKMGRQIGALKGHTESVNAVEPAPDGYFASCAQDNTIKFWDLSSAQDVRRVIPPNTMLAMPTVLSPGGTILAYAQSNSVSALGIVRTITLIDAQTGRGMSPLPGHVDGPLKLAFNGNGSKLASGGRRGDVKVWDISTGAVVCTIPGKDEETNGLAFSPDGRWVAVTHEPKQVTDAVRTGRVPTQFPVQVELFDAQTGQPRFTLSGHPSGVNQLSFSPDGKTLASASFQLVKLWDVSTGVLLRELERSDFQSAADDAVVFSNSGKLLVTAGSSFKLNATVDKTVQVWDVASGRSVAVFQGLGIPRLHVAISPDDTRLVTGSSREVKLWDLRSGQEILNLPLPQSDSQGRPGEIQYLTWSADGQRLRAALNNGEVVEWSASRP